MSAGRHPLGWDPAGRLPSGVYYLKLDADGVTRARSFTMRR